MDEADLGNAQVELNEQRSIKYAQSLANKLEVEPVGKCLYCGEKFDADSQKRWCDKFCRDCWEKRQSMKR